MTGRAETSQSGKTGTAHTRTGAERFGELYEEHMPSVYRFVFYRTGDRSLAEDLTSDIFNKALTAFSRFDESKASFPTWIFTIARNALVDYYRRRSWEKPAADTDDIVIPSGADQPDETLVKSEEYDKLRDCIAKLKPNEQEIISLKFGSNMNNREIAAVTGLSESNVGTMLCRAIKKLRDEFTGW